MAASSSEIAPRKIGRYALHGEIASGGMATVHYGRLLGPVGFSRTVAIKRLHPVHARDPEFVSMFLDEARLAARIRHPNVVPTLDVVAASGELFLVMDWIQGESLASLLRTLRSRGERMPPAVAASIFSGVLQGLHAAHEAKDERGLPLGIVHRDVSPQNVIVGVDGLARVLDFGIAKATVRVGTTRDGQIKGKLSYMAPEQLRAESLTREADIYAASVVFWEMITGQKLFAGDSEGVVIGKILQGDVPPLRKLVPDLPASVEAVTMRGVARDPAERYSTAREMALAVESCFTTASAAEVTAWLEKVAASTLSERAAIVARIEAEERAPQTLPESLAEIGPSRGSVTVPVRIPPPGGDPVKDETMSVMWQPTDARAFLENSGATALSFSQGPPARRNRIALLALGSLSAVIAISLIATRAGHAPAENVATSATPPQSPALVVPPVDTTSLQWFAQPSASSPEPSVSNVPPPHPSPTHAAGVAPNPMKAKATAKKVGPPMTTTTTVKPKPKGAFDDLGERE